MAKNRPSSLQQQEFQQELATLHHATDLKSLKKKYFQLILKYHPDKSGMSHDHFCQIHDVYSRLVSMLQQNLPAPQPHSNHNNQTNQHHTSAPSRFSFYPGQFRPGYNYYAYDDSDETDSDIEEFFEDDEDVIFIKTHTGRRNTGRSDKKRKSDSSKPTASSTASSTNAASSNSSDSSNGDVIFIHEVININ